MPRAAPSASRTQGPRHVALAPKPRFQMTPRPVGEEWSPRHAPLLLYLASAIPAIDTPRSPWLQYAIAWRRGRGAILSRPCRQEGEMWRPPHNRGGDKGLPQPALE